MRFDIFLGNDFNCFTDAKINYDGVREFCLSENMDVGFTRVQIAKVNSSYFKKRK